MILAGRSELLDGMARFDDSLPIQSGFHNRLRYAHNDPVNFTDPSGLEEIPKGTPENSYQGIGKWEFDSRENAYKFFEILLSAEERPKGWKEKVRLGCVGLNSLRVGDPSGKPSPRVFQNALIRKDIDIFRSKAAAEKFLTELEIKNEGAVYYLVAVQISATTTGIKKYNSLGDGPFKINDLSGIIDPEKMGAFNFATLILLKNGDSYWEWMNRGLDVMSDDPAAVTHSTDLPTDYDATFYVVVEKLKWNG